MAHLRRWSALSILILLSFSSVMASSLKVNISGTVRVAAKCIINDNKPLEVNFGEVRIDKLDGYHYQQPLIFTLQCSNLPSQALKLQWRGAAASFDEKVLKTSKKDLGIKVITKLGKQLDINSAWLDFLWPEKPELLAVPVKANKSSLSTGVFTAAATLVVEIS